MEQEFEWDEEKARSNYAKHGVGFNRAKKVFDDVFAVEEVDRRRNYGEERSIIIGMVEGNILTIVYTERENVIRLISARRATKHEQKNYFRHNS